MNQAKMISHAAPQTSLRPVTILIGALNLAALAIGTAGARTQAPTDRGNAQHGGQVFSRVCAACHGLHAEGKIGPPLTNIAAKYRHDALIAFIKNPKQPMPKLYPGVVNDQDVQDVARYLETLKK